MQPHPYQNLHWYPLTSSKNIWPEISVAYFTNDFNLLLLLVGVGGHKRSMLVNDNYRTAEYTVMFLKKKETITKLSTMAP